VTMSGEGSLPFFAAARERAYFTRLEPFPTTSPKALWASLATGKLPYRHGVTGRFSYRTPLNGPDDRFLLLPSGVGFRVWGLIPPVQRISAVLPSGDALPIWTLFPRLSFHASVVGWPSTPPVSGGEPPELATIAPRFNGTGRARDAVLGALRRDLQTAAAARTAIASRRFELDVVALQGFEDAQRALHIGTNELPPRSSMRGEAVRAYAEQLDRIVSQLARDFPDHLLVVVSPSGPVPPASNRTTWSLLRDLMSADDPGADDGFIVITGPDVAHKENPGAAYAVDVVPTVLFSAGLPVGRDMDGRVLIDAFSEEFIRRSTLSVIQTYEAREIVTKRQ